MSTRFTVAEKAVADRDGSGYSIESYHEGVDYVQRKCFKSIKRVFRSDILGVSVVDPSVVEHKQEPKFAVVNEFEAMQVAAPKPQDWRSVAPVKAVSYDAKVEVQECKIVRVHPNFKWVETDKGRVWVGLKGSNMKRGQVIRVKDGELFTGKIEPSGSMVRI